MGKKISQMEGEASRGEREVRDIFFFFFSLSFFFFFFRFTKIGLSDFVGAEGKIDLHDESYA